MEAQIRNLEIKYMDDVKMHINRALNNMYDKGFKIVQSSDYEDKNLSFDIKFNWSFVISVRIRRNKYIKFKDVTIRSKSQNNGKTEIDKIMEGMSNVYFYAYQNLEQNRLVKGYLINVNTIRELIKTQSYTSHNNTDNTSFLGFKIKDIEEQGGLIYSF